MTKRGRPPKSMVLLEMSGATKTNPGRFKDRAPDLEGNGPIGEAPEEFRRPSSDGPKLIALWGKLVAEAPVGYLTASDRECLAKACRLGIEAERVGTKNYLRALQLYMAALKELGMTPGGRSQRGIGGKASTKEVANPLHKFRQAARRTG